MNTGVRGFSSRMSEVRYAQRLDHSIAYRVIECAGGHDAHVDLVFVSAGAVSMESLFEDPVSVRLLDGFSVLGRVVLFDRCGIGLSDPPSNWEAPPFTEWLDDITAVVTTAELKRPLLVTSMAGALVSLAYCLRNKDEVTGLVALEPSMPNRFGNDTAVAKRVSEVDPVKIFFPSRANEPGFREWFIRASRAGASPRLAARAHTGPNELEIASLNQLTARNTIPTLILRRPAHSFSPTRENDEFLALVSGSIRVDVPGADLALFGGEADAVLSEVSRFVTGEHRLPDPERALAAILFTDLVSSTQHATSVGDAHWKRLVDRHDEAADICVRRRNGRVIKSMGDGVLATFPSASSAIRAAREIGEALQRDGLRVRAGVHVGEVDARGADVSGSTVIIAARVMSKAGAGEILVTSGVAAAIIGSGIEFDERGEHELKGIAGAWKLLAVKQS